MKDQVEVKGFRFQVYCYDNVVHIHSPEETEKLNMSVRDFRKKFKDFRSEVGFLALAKSLSIGNFKVKCVTVKKKGWLDVEDELEMSLGKERARVKREEFAQKMDDFKKLVEKD